MDAMTHSEQSEGPLGALRRKLGPRHGQCLVTEYRVGYRYRPQPA